MSPGQTLIYQGEGRGGCTADDAFFQHLESVHEETGESLWIPLQSLSQRLNECHFRFSGMHDRWQVWEKQKTERQLS